MRISFPEPPLLFPDSLCVAQDIDEADAAALEAFMPSNVASGAGGNLADLVMSKIATHEAKEEVKKNRSDMAPQSDKVVEAYTK